MLVGEISANPTPKSAPSPRGHGRIALHLKSQSNPYPVPAILPVSLRRGPGRYRSVCLGEGWRDWFAAGVTAGGKSSDSGLDRGEGKYHLPRPVPLWRIRFEGVSSCWAGRACQVHPGMKRRTCRRIAKSPIGAAGGNAPFRSLFQHQAERHGARCALALFEGSDIDPQPDGRRQSGFKCWAGLPHRHAWTRPCAGEMLPQRIKGDTSCRFTHTQPRAPRRR